MHQALARKWRPRKFSEVIGQEHVVRALRNSIAQDRLHHAYLFAGTRGVGKTTLARIFAKCLNCESGVTAEPCGECNACCEIDEGRFPDLMEVDAASRTGVENMRELLENVQYMPVKGRRKVYLIDEVHMLSLSSFNALLKTLEEPPAHIMFLFATTHPKKIPVTVLSRCLQFNLRRLPHREIAEQLEKLLIAEGIEFEAAAASEIAAAADGSVRDGLSLLEQAVAYGGGGVQSAQVSEMLGLAGRGEIAALLARVAQRDAKGLVAVLDELRAKAVDFMSLAGDAVLFLHEVAVRQAIPESDVDPQFSTEAVASMAEKITPEDTQLFYQIALQGRRDMPLSPSAKNAFEMSLLRMIAFMPLTESLVRDGAADPGAAMPVAKSVARRAPAAPQRDSQSRPDFSLRDYAAPATWPELIGLLGVAGAVKELCDNSTLRVDADDAATLLLDEKLAHLNEGARAQAVAESFARLAGRPIKLSVELASGASETPQQRRARALAQAQQEAVQAVEGDETVQMLKNDFGARVVPGSIAPSGKDAAGSS